MPEITKYKSKEEGDKASKEAIEEIKAKNKASADKWIKNNTKAESKK